MPQQVRGEMRQILLDASGRFGASIVFRQPQPEIEGGRLVGIRGPRVDQIKLLWVLFAGLDSDMLNRQDTETATGQWGAQFSADGFADKLLQFIVPRNHGERDLEVPSETVESAKPKRSGRWWGTVSSSGTVV